MFRRGDVYAYRHDASWPDIFAVGTWSSGTAVHPGIIGRLYRDCRLFIGPIRDRAELARAVA